MPKVRLDIAALYQPTVLLAMALMAVIVMMILPMPPWVPLAERGRRSPTASPP